MCSVSISYNSGQVIEEHSSEIRGLWLMKCSRETLQNLPYYQSHKKRSSDNILEKTISTHIYRVKEL